MRKNAPTVTALLDLAWPRHTERLELRPVADGDLAAIFAYRSREEVSRWVTTWWQDWDEFHRAYSQPELRESTLAVLWGGNVVGDLKLQRQTPWKQSGIERDVAGLQAELGWAFDPAVTGKGFAREAVRELLTIAFTDLGLRRVVAHCFTANEPSWRLMEHLGMRREAHAVADGLHRELGWLDGYTYAMLASEWRR